MRFPRPQTGHRGRAAASIVEEPPTRSLHCDINTWSAMGHRTLCITEGVISCRVGGGGGRGVVGYDNGGGRGGRGWTCGLKRCLHKVLLVNDCISGAELHDTPPERAGQACIGN